MSNKHMLVIGASGKQGGSVVREIRRSGMDIKLRTIARDVHSDRCKSLEEFDVECIHGDLRDGEVLKKAFDGVDTVFFVTNPNDSSQKGIRELEVGKAFVDFAYEQKIKHFIFSALPDVKGESNGKYTVDFFTNKGLIMEYAKARGDWVCSFVGAGMYFQNFTRDDTKLLRREGDTIVFKWSGSETTKIPFCDVNDIGKLVVAQLRDPEKYRDKYAGLGADHLMSFKDFVREFHEETNLETRIDIVKDELLPDMHDLIKWIDKYGYYGKRQEEILALGKEAVPEQKTWRQFLKDTGFKGPAAEA